MVTRSFSALYDFFPSSGFLLGIFFIYVLDTSQMGLNIVELAFRLFFCLPSSILQPTLNDSGYVIDSQNAAANDDTNAATRPHCNRTPKLMNIVLSGKLLQIYILINRIHVLFFLTTFDNLQTSLRV